MRTGSVIAVFLFWLLFFALLVRVISLTERPFGNFYTKRRKGGKLSLPQNLLLLLLVSGSASLHDFFGLVSLEQSNNKLSRHSYEYVLSLSPCPCLYLCLSQCLSLSLSVSPSLCFCLSVFLSICLSLCLCLSLSVCLSVCLSLSLSAIIIKL